ncbi:MAG TPA: hypothetical protein VKD91_09515 [Pyrinomonadaceae bacterium]|nr:hypothetical protein [Pyrinomonadaceae bacterium]
MSPEITRPTAQPNVPDTLKNWIMVVLTLIFISLYGAALVGWLKPLTDEKMVMRLEPIIFVLIGYHFGRMPGQQNERSLRLEINRQTQRADAAQSAKEQALQSNEALEEKIRNVRTALGPEHNISVTSSGSNLFAAGGRTHEDGLRFLVGAALRILNS